jgi:hypothetical protein
LDIANFSENAKRRYTDSFQNFACRFIIILLIALGLWGCRAKAPAPPPRVVEAPPPEPVKAGPAPYLANAAAAPQLAALLQKAALRYDPEMTQEDRDRDFAEKIALAQHSLKLTDLKEMRHRSLDLIESHCGEISWEYLRHLKWPDGTPAGITLNVPVWVPSKAKRTQTYCGFAENWEEVGECMPRKSGWVYYAGDLKDINDKDSYRTETIQFETSSLNAPFISLLMEYIYREGVYDPAKRVPILVLRSGEDTYAASAHTGPVTMEGWSFVDDYSSNLAAKPVRLTYGSMADIHHGGHVKASNHRLGCAMDINDFNFKGMVDMPNAVSGSMRSHNRDALYHLDARNLPEWVFRAAKKIGYRIPQDWLYVRNARDWPHIDCGTK